MLVLENAVSVTNNKELSMRLLVSPADNVLFVNEVLMRQAKTNNGGKENSAVGWTTIYLAVSAYH